MQATAGNPAVFDAVRGIVWPARRKTLSALPGAHIAITRGSSAEFVEYRPYRQGDDPARIDWKLLGRTDRVYVRLSPERAILPTMLVLDGSGSMAFPVSSNAKWVLAGQLSLGLAAVARHGGDPVGLAVVRGSDLRVVAPRTRRTVLDEMIQSLTPQPAGESALLGALTVALRRAARVVIISDFLGDAEEQIDQVRRNGHTGLEVHAVHIVAREELEPERALKLVADPEQPALRRPLPEQARLEYQRRFAAWRDELARGWRSAGCEYTMVATGSEPLRQVVRRIVTPNRGRGT